MPRIAILADIHANLFALDAVIEDLQKQEVDEVIVAGDLVGRGPQGSAVVERVMSLGWPSVRGNHEDYLINFYYKRIPAQWLEDEHWSGARWMSSELQQQHIDYIDALPFSMSSAQTPEVFIVHGSTRSNQEGIGTWTSEEDINAILELVPDQHHTLVCAHTHRPLELQLNDGQTVVNVGSVGLPFNGDWRAQYAILDATSDGTQTTFRQVEYDRQAFLKHYETSGFLERAGITSAMLRMEVLHARPFLVPFLKWHEAHDISPTMAHVPAFLEMYDHTKSMKELIALMEQSVAEHKRTSSE